jgi:hypothetical protein
MAISETDISTIDQILSQDSTGDLSARLREFLPSILVTSCDASDMGVEEPFRDSPKGLVYLVDRSEHCWKITTDPETATGILFAKRRKVQA